MGGLFLYMEGTGYNNSAKHVKNAVGHKEMELRNPYVLMENTTA